MLTCPAYCQRWACENCARKKSRKLAARIERTTAKRFITLTIKPEPGRSRQEELDLLNRAWRTMWKRIKRAQGPKAKGYVRIVELTKAGHPHLHLAVDCAYIHHSTLSAWMAELLDSPIVDIRAIKTQAGLARYLAKYLTKSSEAVACRRRWSQSARFLPQPETDPLTEGELPLQWSFLRVDHETYLIAMLSQGYQLFRGVLLAPSPEDRAPPWAWER